MADSFADTLTKRFPGDQTLAPELMQTLNWMEDQGWLQTGRAGPYMPVYPSSQMDDPTISFAHFMGTDLRYTAHWSTPDPSVDQRIAEIAVTSGDGARAAIWTDAAGDQWFVHLGHDTLGVISRDPLVFLQFMAMGYIEPGMLEQTSVTPLQDAMDANGITELTDFSPADLLTPPVALQTYLADTFNLTFPATAADLGIADFTSYGLDTLKGFLRPNK